MARNGFTLVELMVVIAIAALLAAGVLLTVGSGGGVADGATRFASRVAAARDQAIVSGRPTSVWVTASGYGFDEYRAGRWQPAAGGPLAGRDWERGTSVRVGNGAPAARIRFDSLGLPNSPATVQLARDGRAARVAIAANGDVEVQ